jgi:hypothetical protein
MVALYKGNWKFGAVTLKGWAKPVVTIAALWAVFEAVNISWPRGENYAVVIAVVVVAIVGLVIWLSLRKQIENAGKALAKESDS